MSAYSPVTIDDGLPATSAEIGPAITGGDVELAIAQTLRYWLPSYLSDLEGKRGLERGAIPAPRGWAFTGRDIAKLNSDQLPCIIVVSIGITEPPRKQGRPGALTARWNTSAGIVFAAAWGGKSRSHAQLYARAVSLILTQRPLEGLAAAVDFRGESYDELDFESSRSYSMSLCNFNLDVENVAWADGGPPPYVLPPTDPTAPLEPWATVTETDVTVENQQPE